MTFNLNQLAPNISRVFEISRVGNHTVKLVAGRGVKPVDLQLLKSYYSFHEGKDGNADMIVEVCFNPDDVVNLLYPNSRSETLEEVWTRIDKVLLETPEFIDDTLAPAGRSLLKTSIERLNLGVTDVMQIISVANTIARMSFSDKIKTEHVAEAIQYKSYIPDEQ